jgi:hypothetical protein
VASAFREWLAERLLGTKYATTEMNDDEIDGVAKKIGVDPDLLLEVRARARIERYSIGKSLPSSDPNSLMKRGAQINVFIPQVVFVAWKAECDFRGVDGAALVRSLIHEYLLGEREPEPMVAWLWDGKRHRMGDRAFRMQYMERPVVTHGARRALARRADRRGVPSITIIRALMLEAMTGGHRDVALVESTMMFDDETRYFQGSPTLLDLRHVPR